MRHHRLAGRTITYLVVVLIANITALACSAAVRAQAPVDRSSEERLRELNECWEQPKQSAIRSAQVDPEVMKRSKERWEADQEPPPTHQEVTVGGHTFRIPLEYLAQHRNSRGGFFEIRFFHRGFEGETQGDYSRDEMVRVLVYPASENYEPIPDHLQPHRLLATGHIRREDMDPPGLRTYTSQGHIVYLPRETTNIETVKEEGFVTCTPKNSGFVYPNGGCRIYFMPFEGIKVQLRFDKSRLQHWDKVAKYATKMLTEYKEQ